MLHRLNNRGLGKAYLEAFAYVLTTDVEQIVTMDADFSHDPKYIPDLIKYVKDFDVIIGSRYLHGINVLNWSLPRLILSVSANKYVKTITGLPIKDCTSGFGCYKRQILEQLELKAIHSEGYAFLVELKYKAFLKGFSFKEVPIVFTERKKGKSKMSRRVILEAAFIPWKLRLTR